MINTSRVVRQSTVLAAEWGKYGKLQDNTEYTRSQKGHFAKKKSDETKAKEASERRYTNRSNVCTRCHMAMPVGTGTCDTCA
jgi:hypothetical protein